MGPHLGRRRREELGVHVPATGPQLPPPEAAQNEVGGGVARIGVPQEPCGAGDARAGVVHARRLGRERLRSARAARPRALAAGRRELGWIGIDRELLVQQLVRDVADVGQCLLELRVAGRVVAEFFLPQGVQRGHGLHASVQV